MRVVIDHKGPDGGNVIVAYRSLDDLDRLCQLLSQALVEGVTLLTSDEELARYDGPVRKV